MDLIKETATATTETTTESHPETSNTNNHNGDINDAMEIDPELDATEDDSYSLSLPLSKVKRIFKMDPEYKGASQLAVYATGVATELFIQYLTEQALANTKLEKRKKLVYKDLSNAVSSHDTLYFLNDTVPKTIPLSLVLKEKAKQPEVDIESLLPVTDEPKDSKKATVDILT